MNAPAKSGATTAEETSSPPTPSGDVREFPCDSCGAKLEFHIGQQQLKCPYCGYERALALGADEVVQEQDLEAALSRLAAQETTTTELSALEITCKGCGASSAFSGQLSTMECAFCGAAVQREDAHKSPDRVPVTAVVPFQVEQDKARELLRHWVEGLWLAPGEFKRRGVSGKFNGVYLPFWTFDAMTFCRYRGQRGDDYTVVEGSGKNRRTVTRTRWSQASGSFDRFFDDVTIVATKSVDKKLLLPLEPWPIDRAVPFNPELLAGKQAMTYDIDLHAGFGEAKAQMRDALDTEARRRIGGDRQRIEQLDIKHSALSFKHTLFPVWMLAYRYHEESYHVMVNAITGEVQGERPWSAWKIGLLALLSLSVLGWLFWQAR